jgi:hypothetical protein
MFTRVFEPLENLRSKTDCMLPNVARIPTAPHPDEHLTIIANTQGFVKRKNQIEVKKQIESESRMQSENQIEMEAQAPTGRGARQHDMCEHIALLNFTGVI